MENSGSVLVYTFYFIFWGAIAVILYNYVGYPLVLLVARKKQQETAPQDESTLPRVTLIISAFNEKDVIGQKIENSLKLNYPPELLEILVVSDASTDGTDGLVRQWMRKDRRVRLLRMSERMGKTTGLNAAIQQANGEIVVFSDANAMYNPDAIRQLVKHFQNPEVGYVVGKAVYIGEDDSPAGSSESIYWKYELWLKKLESDFHSVVGGDGAIYAIRKELYKPLEEDDINDFVNPLQIIARCYRGVFTTEAVCYEYTADEFNKEYQRKRRIVNRSWRAFKKYFHLFNFKNHGKFLFLLFSHKVIRWFNWVFMGAIYISTIGINLFSSSPFFRLMLMLEMLFILFSIIGYWFDKRGGKIPFIFYLPYYFHLIHFAAFKGIFDDLQGKKYIKWDHIRTNSFIK